jgi:hypothetical protein
MGARAAKHTSAIAVCISNHECDFAHLTFFDSAASGFTLAAGLRGREVAATDVPRRERCATDLTPRRYCSAKAARLPSLQTAA